MRSRPPEHILDVLAHERVVVDHHQHVGLARLNHPAVQLMVLDTHADGPDDTLLAQLDECLERSARS